jgi:outer membrane protein OmpA-like peptidoglycan-associated protein
LARAPFVARGLSAFPSIDEDSLTMTTHAPFVSLRHILLAGTAVALFALAPSSGFAGEGNVELAQLKVAQKADDKKDDDKGKPAEQKPEPPKAPAAAPKPADKPAEKPAEPPKATDKPAEKPAPAPAPKREPAPPPRAAAPSQPAPTAQKNEPAKPDAKPEQKAAPRDASPKKDAPKEAPKETPKASESAPARQAPAATQAPAAQPKATESKPAESKPAAPKATENQKSEPAKPADKAADKPADKPAEAKKDEAQKDAAAPANPAVVAPPTQARSASEFLQKKGEKASAGFEDVKRQRREVREGNRTFIREPDRTIVRDGQRTIIRHNEASRFAIDARGVHVDRKGGTTTTIVTRPNGVRIITTTDERGHLLRRVRETNGKTIVIIDNTFAGAGRDHFIDVRPPRLRHPRDYYIVEARRGKRDRIYEVFVAPPIEPLARRYTLEQVRYSEPLRSYMPRVDLDINFATGSWQLSPDQVEELSIIAAGIEQAIKKNPAEVFLIEGHTDAVGSDIDNLSLSDRRAEAVAVALTEQFGVPPENLVTQGYGEEYPKVQTDGASQENRRVAVRRITPLIDRQTAGRR